MPAPCRFALHRKNSSVDPTPRDLELEEFQKQKYFIQDNLECTVKFFENVIPPGKWKLKGVMVLEAKEDIEFSGIVMLMKGLPVDQTKKVGEKHLTNVKFTVERSTYSGGDAGGEYMQIDKQSRETYQLEFEIPEKLPPPLITSDGKLIFRMQAFISTMEGRHVMVGEVPVRWMGGRVLTREEIDKRLVIEQHVACRRTFLILGSRKSCEMEWRVGKGGYLAGERIRVELLGESKDKGGLEVECLVEFLQKVWYQRPSTCGRKGKMIVKMKANVLASQRSEGAFEVGEGGGDKKVVWVGEIRVPKRITPTQKFEFVNSISYAIRVSVGVAGESKENWVTGEASLLIGSSKEVMEEEETEEEDHPEGDDEENEEIIHSFSPSETNSRSSSGSHMPGEGLTHRRGSGGLAICGRSQSSQSMTVIPVARPRSGSVSSME